jgi:hypothetical protein
MVHDRLLLRAKNIQDNQFKITVYSNQAKHLTELAMYGIIEWIMELGSHLQIIVTKLLMTIMSGPGK